MHYFFWKICNGLLHFKALLLTGNVTAPRNLKTNRNVHSTGTFLNVTFNDPFVLNSLNVANLYIFKCERATKVENGGE